MNCSKGEFKIRKKKIPQLNEDEKKNDYVEELGTWLNLKWYSQN